MNSLERLKEEFNDIQRDPLSNMGYSIGLFKEDNYYEWDIKLLGAKDSLYAGGLFHIKILFPKEYPDKAPNIIFFNTNLSC